MGPSFGSRGWIGAWSPGIGDPTVLGWVTTAAYLIAVSLCFDVSRLMCRRTHEVARERRLWLFQAIFLLGLGVNKQLDFQTALTEMGRMVARSNGWYERRLPIERGFIFGVALTAVALALALGVWVLRSSWPARVGVVGTGILMGFVVMRAASFRHLDVGRVSGSLIAGHAWIAELGGIATVLAAALVRRRDLRRAARPP